VHATLGDSLADIVRNAVEAGASRIDVEMTEEAAHAKVSVTDKGKGMNKEAPPDTRRGGPDEGQR
jgi:signal transduction histidine kinase